MVVLPNEIAYFISKSRQISALLKADFKFQLKVTFAVGLQLIVKNRCLYAQFKFVCDHSFTFKKSAFKTYLQEEPKRQENRVSSQSVH